METSIEISIINETETDFCKSGEFNSLGGSTEQLFVTHILPYLSSKDLSNISICSRFYLRVCLHSSLWVNLLVNDFLIDEGKFQLDHCFSPTLLSNPFKKLYIDMVKNIKHSIVHKKMLNVQFQQDCESAVTKISIERFLDCTQLRFLIPLPLIASFLTFLLFALHYDGFNISIWFCFTPLLIFFLYLIFCLSMTEFIYKFQFTSGHLLYNLWTNLSSPIKCCFSEIFFQSFYYILYMFLTIILCIIQILLFAFKLTSFKSSPWEIIFIPTWILFLFHYCIPIMFPKVTNFIVVTLFLTPFFLFLICLAYKLHLNDHHRSGMNDHHRSGMPLSYVFIPLNVIECVFILISATFYAVNAVSRGSWWDGDHAALLLASLCGVLPVALLEALLCYKEDRPSSEVTYLDAVAAVLVLNGLLLLCAAGFALGFRTPYQDDGQQRLITLTGALPIYRV